jgi:hypothetical protein
MADLGTIVSAYLSCSHNNYAIPRGQFRASTVKLHKITENENVPPEVFLGKRFNSGRRKATLRLSVNKAQTEVSL